MVTTRGTDKCRDVLVLTVTSRSLSLSQVYIHSSVHILPPFPTPTCSSQHNLLKGWSIVCRCNDVALCTPKDHTVLVLIRHAFTTMNAIQLSQAKPRLRHPLHTRAVRNPNIWEVCYMDCMQTSVLVWIGYLVPSLKTKMERIVVNGTDMTMGF